MKKILGSFFLFTLLVISLSACGKEKNSEEKNLNSEGQFHEVKIKNSMEKDSEMEQENSMINESTEEQLVLESTSKSESISERELLESFAEAYYNFSSIDERNKVLSKFSTKEMIEENGLSVEVTTKYDSIGYVKEIYQNLNDPTEYTIFCESTVNKKTIQSLLICKITAGSKISFFEEQILKEKY